MARRLPLLLAALLAALALAPGAHAAEAQNRVGAFLSDAQSCAPANSAEIPCTHPGSPISRAEIAADYLVAGVVSAGNVLARDALNPSQVQNLSRFERSVPSAGGPITIRELPSGGRAFQADVPATNVPGAFATYEKQVDSFGQTLSFTKTSYAPDGSIVHVKDKISGLTISPPG